AHADHLAIEVDHRFGARHPPFPGWPEEPESAHRLVLVPRSDRRGQNGSGPHPSSIHVWQREVAGSIRYVRVHGKALGIEVDRFASGIRRLRRGWTAYGTREARALLCRAAG